MSAAAFYGAVFGFLVVVGGLTTALILLVRSLTTAQRDANEAFQLLRTETKVKFDVTQERDVLATANAEADKLITELQADLKREEQARKVAEKQRDHMLEELARGGDPRAVGDLINKEIAAIVEIAKPKPPKTTP